MYGYLSTYVYLEKCRYLVCTCTFLSISLVRKILSYAKKHFNCQLSLINIYYVCIHRRVYMYILTYIYILIFSKLSFPTNSIHYFLPFSLYIRMTPLDDHFDANYYSNMIKNEM